MFLSRDWKDYELIDASRGEKLERWGGVILRRPDPQIVWSVPDKDKSELWRKADARYIRSSKGGGSWKTFKKIPEYWTIGYKNLRFKITPMGFKHTGLFPEQASNWNWFSDIIRKSGRSRNDIHVLNLFAYTGGASLAALEAGASVCHVDAAKGMVTRAKENATLSWLSELPIRYIVDDVKKFAERELRRGHKYDGIIMDPPSYGRGPGGEVWKIEDELFPLIELCAELMSDDPLFFLVNTYTTGLSGSVMDNIYKLTLRKKFGGVSQIDEIGLPITNGKLTLPCGCAARWQQHRD